LPSQSELSETSKASIFPSLNLALESLDIDCLEQSIEKVDRALAILKSDNILPGYLKSKDTKKSQEALDYDHYFNVKHVKSSEPEICLLKSILVAYQRFLILEKEGEKTNLENIKIQQQGFKTYFLLFARVYNLITEKNYGEN